MPNLRDQVTLTDEETASFLRSSHTVMCATSGHRGWPHVAPLWYVVDDTPPGERLRILTWTYRRSQKAVNLRRDPRATLLVEDGVTYAELRGVMLECRVELVEDEQRSRSIGLLLAARYRHGAVEDPPRVDDVPAAARAAVERQLSRRIGLAFTPLRRASWDHRKLPRAGSSASVTGR